MRRHRVLHIAGPTVRPGREATRAYWLAQSVIQQQEREHRQAAHGGKRDADCATCIELDARDERLFDDYRGGRL